jgi:hypothetical protein
LSKIYRKLAQTLKEHDEDGRETLEAFDQAIIDSTYAQVDISKERKTSFEEICKILPIDKHKNLLQYFEDSIENYGYPKKTELLI